MTVKNDGYSYKKYWYSNIYVATVQGTDNNNVEHIFVSNQWEISWNQKKNAPLDIQQFGIVLQF